MVPVPRVVARWGCHTSAARQAAATDLLPLDTDEFIGPLENTLCQVVQRTEQEPRKRADSKSMGYLKLAT